MVRCELCTKSIYGSDAVKMNPGQVRAAIQAGYQPVLSTKETESAHFLGVSPAKVIEAWKKAAMERKKEWTFCPACFSGMEPFLKSKKGLLSFLSFLKK